MPRSRARDDDWLMDFGFSGGKACGGFPSCLLTGTGREPGQECEVPPTGGLLLMRFLSCAIHRLGDGKSVLSERAASSKMELFMGAWGQRPQQAFVAWLATSFILRPVEKLTQEAAHGGGKEVQTEYAELMAQKKAAYSGYRKARDEMKELLTVKANVDRIMGYEEEKQTERDYAQEQSQGR